MVLYSIYNKKLGVTMSNIQENAAELFEERTVDDEILFENIDHFSAMKTELGMDSQWSIYDGGPMASDALIFKDKQYKVTYKFILPDATCEEIYNDQAWAEVSMFAPSGSLKDLWFAANSCIKQSGTHHSFIKYSIADEDRTLSLTTGS